LLGNAAQPFSYAIGGIQVRHDDGKSQRPKRYGPVSVQPPTNNLGRGLVGDSGQRLLEAL
jgi:hypothetical protein